MEFEAKPKDKKKKKKKNFNLDKANDRVLLVLNALLQYIEDNDLTMDQIFGDATVEQLVKTKTKQTTVEIISL